ncbi:MAG: hypothetical protein ACRDN0_23280 [Trebonia sp.]
MPPRTSLVFGARTARELYDLPALEKMAAQWPWLTVTLAVSAEPGGYSHTGYSHTGYSQGGTGQGTIERAAIEQGTVADVVARLARAPAHDVYVCGPAAMVAATVSRLESVGLPREQIHFEDFAWSRT